MVADEGLVTPQRHIALIGPSGCGKTTLATALNEFYKIPVCDLDAAITADTGLSVDDIFSLRGEDYFRRLEADMLRRVLSRDTPMIISVGGGTPCHSGNMEVLLDNARVVYLRCDPDTLASRLYLFRHTRPLVKNLSRADITRYVDRMLDDRQPYYLRAHHIFDSSRLETPAQIADAASEFYHIFINPRQSHTS